MTPLLCRLFIFFGRLQISLSSCILFSTLFSSCLTLDACSCCIVSLKEICYFVLLFIKCRIVYIFSF
jgi:hypothetical protein